MLRPKLQKFFLLMAVLPLAVVAAIVIPQILSSAQSTNNRLLRTSVDYASQSVDTFFYATLFTQYTNEDLATFKDLLREQGQLGGPQSPSQMLVATNSLIKQKVKSTPELDACMIVDRYDIVRASTLPQFVGRSFSLDYQQAQKVGKSLYVAPIQEPDEIVGAPWKTDVVISGQPIWEKSQKIGRIVCFYNTDYFLNVVQQVTNHENAVAIFDTENNIVVDGSGVLTPAVLSGEPGNILEKKIDELNGKDNRYKNVTLSINNKSYECVVHLSALTKWPVVAISQKRVLMAPTYRIIFMFLMVSVCCIVVAYFASSRFLDGLIGPLEKKFLPAIYRVANGDRKARIAYNRDDEIGMIARSLNDLMSDLDERETELGASEARYRLIVEGNDYMVFEWNANTDTLKLSKLFKARFGLEPSLTHVSQTLPTFKNVHPKDRAEYMRFCEDIFVRGIDSTATFRIAKLSGDFVWTRAKSIALHTKGNEIYGAIGAFADIDVVKREELRLAEQVRTDTLTQVLTRHAFEETTMGLIEKVQRGSLPGSVMYLCFIDIDDFKDFNTNYGHAFGDRVLRFFGSILNEEVQGYGHAGRVGGDEFALCFTVDKENDESNDIIEHINARLAEGMRTRGSEDNIVITASIGKAAYPVDGESYEELMHHADQDMYARKRVQKTESLLKELRVLEDEGKEEAT